MTEKIDRNFRLPCPVINFLIDELDYVHLRLAISFNIEQISNY